ncbi:diguanylate cyclase domain-containing protein [Nocardia brasiliensis]
MSRDSGSIFRTWWQDNVDYSWLVDTLESRGVLNRLRFVLGVGGIVMLTIAVLAVLAQIDIAGRLDTWQAGLEATFAAAWTLRWWLLPWPHESESVVWIVLFDIDMGASTLMVHYRVIGVLAVMLLVAMGGYVTIFHGPRILVVHAGFSLLTSALLASLIVSEVIPPGGRGPGAADGHWHQDAALGLAIVLVVFFTVGMILPFLHFCQWLQRRDAATDPLTRLLNRRGLQSRLPTLMRGCRARRAFAASVDLDRFKLINDTHGHPFGDRILFLTAARLRTAADTDTVLARTGGDEFILVGKLREPPTRLGERIRTAIETMPDLPITLTASVGVAILDTAPLAGTASLDDLMHAADSAMYQAKRLGGNTVFVTDQPLRQARSNSSRRRYPPPSACSTAAS